MTTIDTIKLQNILECSYYDHRTDYVWQYISGNLSKRKIQDYRIANLESFVALNEMLKRRKYDVNKFMKLWDSMEHPGLLECKYNKRSGILRLKSRSYTFVYRSKTNEYHFTAFADVARSCKLQDRVTHKKYAKGGLPPIVHLVELDEHLYSRHIEVVKLETWKKSPQYDLDIQYCSQMVPTIIQLGTSHTKQLNRYGNLNIILEGNDRVRIGIVEDYSPEEMHAIPSYPREEWQQGIQRAFDMLDDRYQQEVEEKRTEMTRLTEELRQVILGKAPYDTENTMRHYVNISWENVYSEALLKDTFGQEWQAPKWSHTKELFQPNFIYLAGDSHTQAVSRFETDTFVYEADDLGKNATITMKDDAMAKMLNMDMVGMLEDTGYKYHVTPDMLEEYNDYIVTTYQSYLSCAARRKLPQHALLMEMLRHIIEVTAPINAYAGENQTVSKNYRLQWEVTDDDAISVLAGFYFFSERQSFTLDDYKSQFRVWWSQLLLKECKLAKDASLNPAEHLYEELPF